MTYSQKYCIAAFLNPESVPKEFDMRDWPLHVTLADVFAVDLQSNVEQSLKQLLENHAKLLVQITTPTVLGETKVMLVEKSAELEALHNKLIDILESHGVVFNMPAFTGKGFLPHCTVQANVSVQPGDTYVLSQIALIDMFPGGDWQKRRIISTYNLSP